MIFVNYMGFFGYLFLLLFHLINILNFNNVTALIINIILYFGYFYLVLSEYKKIKKHKSLHTQFIKQSQIITKKNEISKGNIIFVLFYLISYLYPKIIHYRYFNLLSLLGNFILLNINKYNNIGHLFLGIFYLFSIFENNSPNKILFYLHNVGCFFLIFHYFFSI
jgi:hypothetical protein